MSTPPELSHWLDKPTLTGDRATLRPFVAADAEAMAVVLADPELLRLTGSVTNSAEATAFPTEPDDKLREWYSTRSTADERLDLAVLDNVTGGVVGEVVLNEYDPDAQSANFRILIGAAGRDRGLGTEATRMIVGHGFDVVGLHRIELGVFAFNPRAQRAYAKVGFVLEGTKRQAFRFDGEYVDDVIMSILSPEWATHRGHPQQP